VLSYFINHVQVHADTLLINRKDQKGKVILNEINFNSDEQSLEIAHIESISTKYKNSRTFLNKLLLRDMNVKAFIEEHQIQTGTLSCEGGAVTVFAKKESSALQFKNQSFDFPEDFFDEIKIGSLQLGNTDIIIRSHEFPDREAITIHQVRFNVLNEINVVQRKTIRQIVSQANWEVDAASCSFETKNKLYTISIQGIKFDKAHSLATIQRIALKPILSKEAFGNQVKKQTDYYDLELKNIQLNGIDFEALLNSSTLNIQQAKTSIDLRVYNDRLLDVNNESKVGNYPHQQILKLKMPFYIKQFIIDNSYVSYTERAFQTK